MSVHTVYQLPLVSGWFETRLDPNHPLVILAQKIDWETLTDELITFYSKNGRKAKPPRLMIGLHILKHLYNLSDEEAVRALSENIYYRYFCGLHSDFKLWSSEKALDSSTMTKFRQRISKEGMQVIEKILTGQLLKEKRISPKTQLIDTTAMEKNITYPVDTHLLARGMRRVVGCINKMKKLGLSVDIRSFKRLIRKEILQMSKLGRGSKERREVGTKRLIGYAQQILKSADLGTRARKKNASATETAAIERLKKSLKQDLLLLERVINQAEKRMQGIHIKNKVLSFHEPDTTVIAKGKRSKRYEFGAKVSLSQDSNGYILGHQEYHENVADINTAGPAIADWAKKLGEYPDELGADRAYHTSNPPDELCRIKRLAIPTRGRKKHPDHNKPYFRRMQRYRNRIEPTIGHLKTDHRMDKCRYKGKIGDTQNVAWAVLAWNSKKWAREIQEEQKSAA